MKEHVPVARDTRIGNLQKMRVLFDGLDLRRPSPKKNLNYRLGKPGRKLVSPTLWLRGVDHGCDLHSSNTALFQRTTPCPSQRNIAYWWSATPWPIGCVGNRALCAGKSHARDVALQARSTPAQGRARQHGRSELEVVHGTDSFPSAATVVKRTPPYHQGDDRSSNDTTSSTTGGEYPIRSFPDSGCPRDSAGKSPMAHTADIGSHVEPKGCTPRTHTHARIKLRRCHGCTPRTIVIIINDNGE